MSNDQGILLVIAATSGTGKSTICQKLLESHKNAALSISYTTREPRDYERDGEHYHFVNVATFEEMIGSDDFLEHAKVHDHYYGTSKQETQKQLQAGFDVLLDIDVQGAQALRDIFGSQAVLIFLLPPRWQDIKERLKDRGTDSKERIARRLETAQDEIPLAKHFDYLVINDRIDRAVKEVISILQVERLRPYQNQKFLEQLIQEMKDESIPSA